MASSQELLLGTGTAVNAFQIQRSLRFNSADSANLSRTPSSTGNRRTFTFSAWVKLSSNSTDPFLMGAGSGGQIWIISDKLRVRLNGSPDYYYDTAAVFRDFSAWYHVVVAVDTTDATAADRVKIYINGTRQTIGASVAPPQNFDTEFNLASTNNRIGQWPSGGQLFNGYMTNINFIDGQALTPSSFGETNADTGVWQPKAYSGTYGTNGFQLLFADNSGTTSTTLGKDTSGNGNNWTPNNFSVTAGAGNDSLVDTPTPYGTDTGAGGEVRGNYCTLNPLNNQATSLVNGNLDSGTASGVANWLPTSGTIGVSSGKWYWEVRMNSAEYLQVGILPAAYRAVSGDYPGSASTTGYGYQSANGNKYVLGTGSSYGATFTTGDVIGVALDLDGGTLVFYKNGSSQGTAASSISGTFVPGIAVYNSTGASTVANCNFGQRPFAYTAPSGFKALCTQNLPTPTIGATATTRADDYFNTVLWTGDGANPRTITGVGFQPDLVWVKRRDGVSNNFLQDAVRGVTSTDSRSLVSNATDAETNYYTVNGGVTAFTSDGFTTSGGTTNNNLNNSGNTMVAWNWKANGAGSTNTSGTITSTVSANTTSGFSIVTWTGNSSNATIGHGLGVAPSMYIIKYRGTTDNWYVYHTSTGAGQYLVLNGTNASTSSTNIWQNTAPTSTVFSIGFTNNQSTIVAYCFAPVAGYSAFGSYVGNGVGFVGYDGPFVYTGFRPRYLLIKVASGSTDMGAGKWCIYDAVRNPYNVTNLLLYANLSSAESNGSPYLDIDILSNGFKIRGGNFGEINGNGNTYIYAAFAENPFKYSLAR